VYGGFNAAFTAASQFGKTLTRLHRTQMPKPPRHWQEMESHQFAAGYKAAAKKE
jgi:hypothetical protein